MEAATIINRGKANGAAVEQVLRSAGIEGPVEAVEGKRIAARAKQLVEQALGRRGPRR